MIFLLFFYLWGGGEEVTPYTEVSSHESLHLERFLGLFPICYSLPASTWLVYLPVLLSKYLSSSLLQFIPTVVVSLSSGSHHLSPYQLLMVVFLSDLLYPLQCAFCTALQKNFLQDNLIMSLFGALSTPVFKLSSHPTVIGGFSVSLPNSRRSVLRMALSFICHRIPRAYHSAPSADKCLLIKWTKLL